MKPSQPTRYVTGARTNSIFWKDSSSPDVICASTSDATHSCGEKRWFERFGNRTYTRCSSFVVTTDHREHETQQSFVQNRRRCGRLSPAFHDWSKAHTNVFRARFCFHQRKEELRQTADFEGLDLRTRWLQAFATCFLHTPSNLSLATDDK